jgi:aldehyde dehydrogenase (NAD+)
LYLDSRIIIHESIYDKVKEAIVSAYKQLRIGNPLDENNHVGPVMAALKCTAKL